MPILIGALAHPALRARLAPQAEPARPLGGRLIGGRMAGIVPGAFPSLIAGAGEIPAWEAPWTDDLRRYADLFGLAARLIDGREVLGLGEDRDTGAWQADLAAAMADRVLGALADRPTGELRPRLAMIAGWLASRLRAGAETAHLPHIGPPGPERLRDIAWDEPYGEYFSVETHILQQRRNQGDWSAQMRRAVFVSGDATVVLPWDPVRDRVLLIDQLRAGPVLRGDAQPWLYETVAGRVDPGETPAQAAIREGREETGINVSRLFAASHNYPSPGAVAEYLYLYVGIADLPDGTAGLGGLDSEDEDIRSHLIARAELTRMALAGELRNGPLLSLALWLELSAARLRAELAAELAV